MKIKNIHFVVPYVTGGEILWTRVISTKTDLDGNILKFKVRRIIMGYNLHIVRQEKDNLIEFDEVEKLVEQYSELELKEEMKIRTPDGNTISIPGTYILWKKKEFDVWWNYNRGKISSSYISDDGIEKLRKIAYELDGQVIGDEGEEY